MMKKQLSMVKYVRWLIAALLLAVLYSGLGHYQVTLANGYYPPKTPTPTATFTPTATPTRPIEACQVTAVIFDQESYTQGETMAITVRVADAIGNPLAGAKVVADVTRRDFDNIATQAATGFGLIDRTGDYDGVYDQTDTPGFYDFKITVSDPVGGRFLPCMATATVSVTAADPPTPTYTPTFTDTPTITPTPTHTPTPTSPTIRTRVEVEPDNLQTTLCSFRETVAINVAEVTNLLSVELEIAYDPTVIQVIDGDAGQRGVQVRVGNIFATGNITRNEVDTRNGRIYFTATRLSGYTQSIPDGLIAIDWRPQRVGHSDITLVRAVLTDTNGQEIPAEINDGGITVNFVPNCNVAGAVSLQGRTDFTNVIVTNSAGAQTQTAADGSFVLKADQVLTFKFPGYLSTEIDLSDPVEIVEADGQTVQVDDIDLLAGDVNGDDEINVLDLVQIAASISTANNVADLNGDGQVDILDLVTAAGNFQQAGPVAAWQ